MKLETFFEKFNQFADAPNAGAKMRGLVLELAVQGRLSASLPDDGVVPAEAEFREAAAVLANSLGLRSPKESVEETEPPFDVPTHWRWMALADMGVAQTGTTPSKTDHAAFNGEIPFIKPADILPDSINYSNESLTRHGAESGSRLAPSGSLLMVCIGTIGKCNLIERECAFNQQINALTPVAFVDSRYLLAAARSRFFQEAAWKKSSSTTIAILNKGKWLSIPVPLPPLAEQKRIVAKVDALIALCDRLEAQQQERERRYGALARASLARFADAPTPANLHHLFHPSYAIAPTDLRKTVLTLAVQGELVPQDPNDARVSQSTQISSPSEAAVADAPHDVPQTWAWVYLGDLARFINGDRSKNYPSKSYRVETGVPFINAGHLSNGDVSLDDMDYITEAHFGLLGGGKVERGDVLYCLRGSLGKSAVVSSITRGAIASSLLIIRPSERIHARFLYAYLTSPLGELMISRYDSGSAQPNLSAANVKKYLVPLPPFSEQRRIVTKVDQLMALMDQLETQLATSRATGANLVDAMVSELSAAA
jgi:type I restriction enzyme S subunit